MYVCVFLCGCAYCVCLCETKRIMSVSSIVLCLTYIFIYLYGTVCGDYACACAGMHVHIHAGYMLTYLHKKESIIALLCCSLKYSIEIESLSELGARLMAPVTCLSLPQWP